MKRAIALEARRELSRREFWEFCLLSDNQFFSKRPFLKDIAYTFQDVFNGRLCRISVSLPPRSGKSYLTSMFAAWCLGKKPNGSIMRNCCTGTLYDKFSYDTRAIILSLSYQEIFPAVKLSEDKQSLKGWSTTTAKQVSYFGAGVGGTIIGFGASTIAITDDLFKSFEEAISEQICEKTYSWYRGNHIARMERFCPSIDIGTRWSKKDVIGRNIQEGYYDQCISVPALTDHGESFCEDVKTTDEYLDIKARTAPEIWHSEFMQEPIEATGTLFKQEDIQVFSLANIKKETVDAVLAYIDVADEGDDFFAMAIAHLFKQNVFITDVIYTRDNIDVTLPLAAGLLKKNNINYVRVEANNQGSVFIKMLRQQLSPDKILAVKNVTNKHSRILMQYGFIKQYFKRLKPEETPRNSDYQLFFENVFSYIKVGTSRKDDAPDCLAGLAKFIQSFMPHIYNL